MTERLSDERLRELIEGLRFSAGLRPGEASKSYHDAADSLAELLTLRALVTHLEHCAVEASITRDRLYEELLALRAQLAAGPVMPETPPMHVTYSVVSDDPEGLVIEQAEAIYGMFRDALAAEQNDPR